MYDLIINCSDGDIKTHKSIVAEYSQPLAAWIKDHHPSVEITMDFKDFNRKVITVALPTIAILL
jgi:hypothetical protein